MKPEQGLPQRQVSRRRFLGEASLISAVAAGAGLIGAESLVGCGGGSAAAASDQPGKDVPGSGTRPNRSFQIRIDAAKSEKSVPVPNHVDNGDEVSYSNRVGNFSKGLPHDSMGEVVPSAYQALLRAVESEDPAAFEAIPLGGSTLLVNPQGGLAFDLEGTDCGQVSIPPAPALASAERAGEAVEAYWQALLRDVPFSQYGNEPQSQAAIADLNRLSDFRGPRDPATGAVSGRTLFRGFTSGDLIGPYISQFFYQPFDFGAAPMSQRYQTYLPLGAGGADYLTNANAWLACQNGQGPFAPQQLDPTPRFIRNGRDLAAWVHIDVLYQAYFQAALIMLQQGVPLNPGNPYTQSRNQIGFGTFGTPYVAGLLGEVAIRALKAVWHEKWFVHRALRPEEYGGLVHKTLTGARSYALNRDVLNSQAVQQTFSRYRSYFLPLAFSEGCPQHPSYGSGHATVAGACATILKAAFDERASIRNPLVASDDGLSLTPYTGADAGRMTIGGELNKIASNVGIGRNIAGVHWRSDYRESLILGETIAISILRDQRGLYNEAFRGFTFTRLDGTPMTV